MKNFYDLIFKERQNGWQARANFANGYGVSVIQGSAENFYELAVTRDGAICYSTPITDDVIGHLRPEEVSKYMLEIASLPNPDADPCTKCGGTGSYTVAEADGYSSRMVSRPYPCPQCSGSGAKLVLL